MKIKIILFILLSFLWKLSFAFNTSEIVGEWAVYESPFFGETSYYYLNVNPDFSGELHYSFEGDAEVSYKFDSQSTLPMNGYVEILLRNKKTSSTKMILSAWTKDNKKYGRLAGLIFIYDDKGNLVNTLYMPLDLINESNKLGSKKEISKLRNN